MFVSAGRGNFQKGPQIKNRTLATLEVGFKPFVILYGKKKGRHYIYKQFLGWETIKKLICHQVIEPRANNKTSGAC